MLSKLIKATWPCKRAIHLAIFAALGALLWVPGLASATQPRALDVQSITGCCTCRGTKNGEKTSVRSCSDGLTADACQAKCANENAGSLVFGYQQTCSQGCAGFATQNLK